MLKLYKGGEFIKNITPAEARVLKVRGQIKIAGKKAYLQKANKYDSMMKKAKEITDRFWNR